MGETQKTHQAQKGLIEEQTKNKGDEFFAEYEKLCLKYGMKLGVIPKFTPVIQLTKLNEEELTNLKEKYANIT